MGTEVEPQLSSQTRYYFNSHAVKDEEKDEYFMGEDQFVDAIAPQGEDYVRMRLFPFCCLLWRRAEQSSGRAERASSSSSNSNAAVAQRAKQPYWKQIRNGLGEHTERSERIVTTISTEASDQQERTAYAKTRGQAK